MNLDRYLELHLKYFYSIRKDKSFGFSLLIFINTRLFRRCLFIEENTSFSAGFQTGALKHHCNYSDAGYLAEIEILDDSPQLNYGSKLY